MKERSSITLIYTKNGDEILRYTKKWNGVGSLKEWVNETQTQMHEFMWSDGVDTKMTTYKNIPKNLY